jgi:hypothetical protein
LFRLIRIDTYLNLTDQRRVQRDPVAGALVPGTRLAAIRRQIDQCDSADPQNLDFAGPAVGRDDIVAYAGFAAEAGVDAVALDTSVDPAWAAPALQSRLCVQGNLDPLLMVTGGAALERAARATVEAFAGGPHVFNLGHGITPDADPAHVERMLRVIRG